MRSKVGPPPPGTTRELGVAAMYILSPRYTPAGNECQNLSPVLDLSFRESASPDARKPSIPCAGSPRFATSGGFESHLQHSIKVDGGSSNEVYPALLESRLTTMLTGALTGTGYRRITPHPTKHP